MRLATAVWTLMTTHHALCCLEQFDDVLDAYRKQSKNWSSVFNRFSEGEGRTQTGATTPPSSPVKQILSVSTYQALDASRAPSQPTLVCVSAVRMRGRKRTMVG